MGRSCGWKQEGSNGTRRGGTDDLTFSARYDWVTSYKVQFSNDSQIWWGSQNLSSGMDAVSESHCGPIVSGPLCAGSGHQRA